MEATLPDVVAEGARVAEAAARGGVTLRLAGGVAIALRCPSAASEPLRRRYADVDLAGRAKQRRQIVQLLEGLGYEADREFNALHGARRLYFWDHQQARQVDVFLDRVRMCHAIEIGTRLEASEQTLALADLLLMKLQIVEANDKDLTDILTLLVDHPFTDDDTGINLRYLSGLAATDWGLWKTTTMIAERADHHARRLDNFAHAERVHEQVRHFLGALEEVPKTTSWKLRAKVGERKRWYELPEETH